MKIAIFTIIVLIFNHQAVAQVCEIPMNKIQVAGIYLAQDIEQFKKNYPAVKEVVLPIQNHQLEFDGEIDQKIRNNGVTWISHIGYNPKRKKVESFSLRFLDGTLASYQTDLDVFKTRVMKHANLPKKGWKQQENRYKYQCNDYVVEIIQDHGAVHTAVGPTVIVFSKYSSVWDAAQK